MDTRLTTNQEGNTAGSNATAVAITVILTEIEREELLWLARVLPLRHLPIKRRVRTLLMSTEGFSEYALSVLFSATIEVIRQWKQDWRGGGMEHLYGAMEADGIATTELRNVWARVGHQ